MRATAQLHTRQAPLRGREPTLSLLWPNTRKLAP
jgi:hypothetical protein